MNKKQFIENFATESEGDYTIEQLSKLSDFDLFDKYLKWNGIVGYTYDILDAIQSIRNQKEDLLK